MDHHIERRRQDEMNSIAEQAAGWLLELETGGTPEQEAFRRWVGESPLHVEAFLWASSVDELLTHVDPAREIAIDLTPAHPHPAAVVNLAEYAAQVDPPQRQHEFRWRWAAAAAIVALIASGWWLTSDSRGWQSYSTAIGEQRSVLLADGSTVHINTGSRVDVRFSPQGRDVRLLAGEALFNVQRNPARPFRVHAAGAVVQAVGTQFDVYQRAANTMVSVLEGRVKISSEPKVKIAPSAVPPAHTLDAGEQADVSATGTITQHSHMDAVQVTAWRQRRLVFSNDTLADIAAEFNRYNEAPKILVEGDATRERRYAAGFDADDPESLLQFLAKDPTLEVERTAGELVIRSREGIQ